MNKRLTIYNHLILLNLIIYLSVVNIFGQRYQKSFYVENRFDKEIKIPVKALNALEKEKSVKKCINFYKLNKSNLLPYSSKWFRATKVNLNNDKFPDLIVEHNTPCLSGVSRQPYWLLISNGKNYNVVFYGYTYSLYINTEKTNKHFNVTIDWATASTLFTETFGFDGKRYERIAYIEKPNN